MEVIALQLSSPDLPDVLGALGRKSGEQGERPPAAPAAPRVQWMGGQPTSEAAEELARRIAADRASGKLDGIQGTPEGRAWFFGEG